MSKSENPEKNGNPSVKAKIRLYALVCLLIIGVWSLASLPIIFYHLPKSEISSNTTGSTNVSYSDTVCSAPIEYATTSGICQTELTQILRYSQCSPGTEGNLLVIRNEEVIATQLINGLSTLGASTECLSQVVAFLCLHLFGLCGESGISIQPTSRQCEQIRSTTCNQQWMFVERLDIGLPNCAIFPAESTSCSAPNKSLSTNGTVTTNMLEKHSNYSKAAALECTEEFYQENGSSYCTRSCSTWVQFGYKSKLIHLLETLFTSTSFLVSAAIIIISCLAHKRMLSFPAIFIVYMVIDYLVLDILAIFSYIDSGELFCTSSSLIKSLTEVTPFCVISAHIVYSYAVPLNDFKMVVLVMIGILSTYAGYQMYVWWLFHTTTLFWKVSFPFHAQTFEASGKNRYIYITCVIVGILLPLVPIIIVTADTAMDLQKQYESSTSEVRRNLFFSQGLGFGYIRFPPIVCTVTNSDAHFYSIFLMLQLIIGCGCTMLIIIIWSIHKVYIKRKEVQNNIIKISGPTFRTAEKKLLIVLCYYGILGGIVHTIFTWHIRSRTDYVNHTLKLLFCEQGSHSSSNSCTFSSFDTIAYQYLLSLSWIFFSFIPIVNLLYVVNIQELKKLWKKRPWSKIIN